MKKNTFIKVISLVMAAGVILGSYGCKDSKTPLDSNANNSDSELSSITTVIKYTSVNKKGKEKQETNVATIVDPNINKVQYGPMLSDKFSDDKSAKDDFKEKAESYGADDKKVEEIINDAENWQTFTYDYYVSNPFSQRIAFRSITGTPKDGILINSELGYEKGIASGKGSTIFIEGLVDTNKYKDEEAIKKALNSMKPQIIYTFIKSIDDTIDDWSKVETKMLPIDITR